MLGEVFNQFVQESPVTVMARAMMEKIFNREHLEQIFSEHAQKQYQQEMLFSSLVGLMSLVVCGIHKSVNSAYKKKAEEMGVSVKSVYNKLQRVEPQVSRALLSETARELKKVGQELATQAKRRMILPDDDYEVKILDGTSLKGTDRRLKVLREQGATPLPGKALVVYEPRWDLITDVFPCEDSHSQERSLLDEVLKIVKVNQVWVGDRNFCTYGFLANIADTGAYFVIREHGNCTARQVSGLVWVGSVETGEVWEQEIEFEHQAQTYRCRRIIIQLYQATRQGEKQVVIWSNLPAEGTQAVSAITIAELYRNRWTIETKFQVITENFEGEISTLAYPKAALFSFCLALCSYNILATVKMAIASVHELEEGTNNLSDYYLVDEMMGTYRGMMVALPPLQWKKFASFTLEQMAGFLIDCAMNIELKLFLKNPSKVRKKKPKPRRNRKQPHVSTARLLASRLVQ